MDAPGCNGRAPLEFVFHVFNDSLSQSDYTVIFFFFNFLVGFIHWSDNHIVERPRPTGEVE